MEKRLILSFLIVFLLGAIVHRSNAQCGTAILGQNLVVNGDFSAGDVSFNSPLGSWNDPTDGVPCNNPNPMTCPRFWSGPGEYWVHTTANDFNPGSFSSVPSPASGGNMMLVDADCNPGGIVWEQTVNVTPASNYYFSLRIASIHPASPGRLSFEVNGVVLGTNVNAPATTNTWLFYEDTWNSGALSGPVQLRIIEQSGVGCTNGDDFAIDDISFIGGCQFGAAGPTPNLGPDQTLCGKGGSITLNAGVPAAGPLYTYTWSRNGTTVSSGSAVSAVPNLNVSTIGTYSVCVSYNGSCLRSDVVVITDVYSINLGPDRNLCNPPTVTLDAGYTGPGVTYLWTYNGSPIPAASSQTYVANQAGTFAVEVNDPVCGIRSDEIIITSSTVTANNAQFCATPSAVNLSINGSGGTYNWYSAASGGTLLQSNSTTYTTPPISATTTYYVEDASSFSYTFGPPSNLAGWGRSGNLSNDYLRFNALSPFVLDFVTVYAYNGWNGNFTVQIVLANSAGTVLATSAAVPLVGTVNTTMHRIPVGISVPVGTDLRMYAITSGGQIHYDGNTHPTTNWPYQVAGVVSLHSNVSGGSLAQNSYNHLYNWEISSGAICARVPVQAVQFCPPSCTPPTSASISNPSPVTRCTAGSVILNANSQPGYLYSWIRNGVIVAGPTLNMFNYTATTDGSYSVRITESGSPFCFLQSAAVQVVEFNVGAVNLIPDYTTCDPSQTLDAIVNGTGVTYIWERNAAVIPGAVSQTYTISQLGAYRVWVNHPICGMATDVTVVGPGSYSINLGADRNLCTPTAYTLDAGFTAAGVTYQWQSPIGSNISGAASQTYYVNTPGTYRVVVTHPFCGVQNDDIVITTSVGSPVNDNFCSDDPGNNTATLGITGAGPYAWYAASTGGSSLTTGNSYTTPVLTGPTTYYVESTASFKYNKGPKAPSAIIDPGSAFPAQTYLSGGGFNSLDNSHYLQFTALTNMTFDSVTVFHQYVGFAATASVTLEIINVTTSTTTTLPAHPIPNTLVGGPHDANPRLLHRVPVNMSLIAGNSYRIRFSAASPNVVRFQPGGGPAIPIGTTIFDQAGVVDFTAYAANWQPCLYPGFFDFVFSSGVACNRVPVQAIDGAPCIAAPISWIDFTATSQKTEVVLDWSNASEVNNKQFYVQRSVDGIHWETIGVVAGSGTTQTISSYTFIDKNPLEGNSYYRIVQEDFNGEKDNSEVRLVNRTLDYMVTVSPNPFSNSTNIFISGVSSDMIEIEVVDVNGKTVFSRSGELANQSIEIGKDLASGLYFLKVSSDVNVKNFKLLKQ